MVFGLFKKKDPICGMKEEKGKGFVDEQSGNWFCSNKCKEEFAQRMNAGEKKMDEHSGCCH